jgi:hypothetical protein
MGYVERERGTRASESSWAEATVALKSTESRLGTTDELEATGK